MTASSGLVLSNLAYLIGAVVLAVAGGVIVWMRHRKPKSVAANVAYFHRGLQALAPDERASGSGRHVAVPERHPAQRPELRSVAIVRPHASPDSPEPDEVAGAGPPGAGRPGAERAPVPRRAAAAGDDGEQRSGAEAG